jgi:GMP synthase-like glutamine amidotransferase
MKKVLILDGAMDRRIYRPTDHWTVLLNGAPSDSVHLPSGESISSLGSYSHVIVTGSEASIMLPEPWFEVEAAAVREAFDLGKPIFGSCFGHQMLARAISGAETVAASPTPEVGWIDVERIDDDYLFDGLSNPFSVFAVHFDEVPAPPPPWKTLAKSPNCQVHAMRYGDRPIWGVQAHPEIGPEQAGALLREFKERSPERAQLFQAAIDQTPRDHDVAGEIVWRFLKFG